MSKNHDARIVLAHDIIEFLTSHPIVNTCKLHGSLATENFDVYSDIDLQVDVSGHDNGKFMLMMPERMGAKYPIIYSAFAPGLLPDVYLVSFATSQDDIFAFIDIECVAIPHVTAVTREDVQKSTDFRALALKLTIGNTKHFLRGQPCRSDIVRIANYIMDGIDVERRHEKEILMMTLQWLEAHCEAPLHQMASQCRQYLE